MWVVLRRIMCNICFWNVKIWWLTYDFGVLVKRKQDIRKIITLWTHYIFDINIRSCVFHNTVNEYSVNIISQQRGTKVTDVLLQIQEMAPCKKPPSRDWPPPRVVMTPQHGWHSLTKMKRKKPYLCRNWSDQTWTTSTRRSQCFPTASPTPGSVSRYSWVMLMLKTEYLTLSTDTWGITRGKASGSFTTTMPAPVVVSLGTTWALEKLYR